MTLSPLLHVLEKYERIGEALLLGWAFAHAQTCPVPWLMGGQQYHNPFLIRRTPQSFRVFDTAFAHLPHHAGLQLPEHSSRRPLSSWHIHLYLWTAMARVDGEGVQAGEGDVDWASSWVSRVA